MSRQVRSRSPGEVAPVRRRLGAVFLHLFLSHTTYFWWGRSYASTTETAQYKYTGRTYAAANIYKKKRVVQTCFTYTRGEETLVSRCSNAHSSNGKWVPGAVVSKAIKDSLKPNAPKTKFHYSTRMINPNVR